MKTKPRIVQIVLTFLCVVSGLLMIFGPVMLPAPMNVYASKFSYVLGFIFMASLLGFFLFDRPKRSD